MEEIEHSTSGSFINCITQWCLCLTLVVMGLLAYFKLDRLLWLAAIDVAYSLVPNGVHTVPSSQRRTRLNSRVLVGGNKRGQSESPERTIRTPHFGS